MSLFFKTRTGQTPVDASIVKELKLPHLQNMSELYEQEEANIASGILWTLSTNKHHVDYRVWLEIHGHMLNEVWRFAGKIRKTELQNTDFKKSFEIAPALLTLEQDLKVWLDFQTYPPEELLAIFHERLLTIHPFRDGNGRWARVVTEFVARKENFPIPNWGGSDISDDDRREKYIQAVKIARHQLDYADLMKIMFS